jgi:hypothetical protein
MFTDKARSATLSFYSMNDFTIQMVSIYKNGDITQNGMIDKIKSCIFNSNLILSITINANIFHNRTLSLIFFFFFFFGNT